MYRARRVVWAKGMQDPSQSQMMSKLPYVLRGLLEPVGIVSQVPELLLELDRDRDQRTAAMGRDPFVDLFEPLILLPDEAATGRQSRVRGRARALSEGNRLN